MQPDPEYLRDCFLYDATLGILYWKERPREHFKSNHAWAVQRARAGNVAGCHDHSTGYRVIGRNEKVYYAHRLIWAMTKGAWPEEIDHINGDRLDNSWSNLREVSHAVNNRNTRLRPTNNSGTVGVSFAKRELKWRARITHEGRDIHLGYFDTWGDAVNARAKAAERFGFHKNHGRTA
jgi:hypothetical protein